MIQPHSTFPSSASQQAEERSAMYKRNQESQKGKVSGDHWYHTLTKSQAGASPIN